MIKYRKKPVVIEAIEWNGNNFTEIKEFIGDNGVTYLNHYILIETLEGPMRGDIGDYIIKGIKGEYYPCKPDIFKATYDIVEDGNPTL